VSGAQTRVFIARLADTAVFDPIGDQVGRVRDVVVTLRIGREPPRVLGLVIEVPGRRRIFLPLTRVTSIDAGHVITTGLVNMRRFEQRPTETLVLAELLDRTVALVEDGAPVTVEDVAMEQQRTRDWAVTKVFVRRPGKGRGLRRRGDAMTLDWDAVTGFALAEEAQGAANLLATFEKMNAADLATLLHEPELIILDEPQSGLDPVNVVLVRNLLRELRDEGRTILLSTHMMSEAEKMADDIVLVHNGHVVLSGTLDQVRTAHARNALHLEFEGDGTFLRALPEVASATMGNHSAELTLAEGADPQKVLQAAVGRVRVRRFEIASPSLEEIFIETVDSESLQPTSTAAEALR